MEVIFLSSQKLGNKYFAKGKHQLDAGLLHNAAFKQLVKAGVVKILPKNEAAQKIQLSKDMKAAQWAKEKRALRQALPSAQGALGAKPASSSASKPVQASILPPKPIQAGASAPAPALKKGKGA